MEVKKKEYVHMRTDNIKKELWVNPYMEQTINNNFTKPRGGLWLSNKTDHFLCEWIEYNKYERCLYDEDKFYAIFNNKDGCFVKLKEGSKILNIQTPDDFNKLREKGYVINLKEDNKKNYKIYIDDRKYDLIRNLYHKKIYSAYLNFDEILDYEKIIKNFDAIIINLEADISFIQFDIKQSIFVINPDSIEYYRPFKLDLDNLKPYNISDNKIIVEPTEDYYKLVEYIKIKFNDIDFNGNYDEYINKLNNYVQIFSDVIKPKIADMGFKLNQSLDLNRVIETIIKNIYIDKYREKKKLILKS